VGSGPPRVAQWYVADRGRLGMIRSMVIWGHWLGRTKNLQGQTLDARPDTGQFSSEKEVSDLSPLDCLDKHVKSFRRSTTQKAEINDGIGPMPGNHDRCFQGKRNRISSAHWLHDRPSPACLGQPHALRNCPV
jgi:hypothetical protein